MPKSKDLKRVEAIQRQIGYYRKPIFGVNMEIPKHIKLSIRRTYNKISGNNQHLVKELVESI